MFCTIHVVLCLVCVCVCPCFWCAPTATALIGLTMCVAKVAAPSAAHTHTIRQHFVSGGRRNAMDTHAGFGAEKLCTI